MLEWLKPLTQGHTAAPLREPAAQAEVDAETAKMSLYYFATCPYCVRVRRAISKLQLNIELRNIHKERHLSEELAQGGGKTTVPCLRLEKEDGSSKWMYESRDIVAYLTRRFSPENAA
jgi:glutathione S-transferase